MIKSLAKRIAEEFNKLRADRRAPDGVATLDSECLITPSIRVSTLKSWSMYVTYTAPETYPAQNVTNIVPISITKL